MKTRVLALVLALAAAAEARATDFCFGAVGQQCGGISIAGVQFAACTPYLGVTSLAVCAVSAGSMTHDPCCADSPRGKMCGAEPEIASLCSAEWDRAVHRFAWGYQWNRLVDRTQPNTSGNVVRADYCARPGQGLHRNDTGFCCSREARRANFWERLGRPNLRICR